MTVKKLFIFKINRIVLLLRAIRFHYFFKTYNLILFKNIICRFKPKSIEIGKRFTVFNNCILEFNNSSNVKIGNNCLLSYGVVMALKGDFEMGDNVMIGEYTSIRDYSHDYTEQELPMTASKDIIGSIKIGNNVWIGRGCIIMANTVIEDGVVIGANSIVKGHFEKDCIYAGNPIKFLKKRV